VFTEDDPSPVPSPSMPGPGQEASIPPLDGPHSSLLRMLGRQATWPRAEVEAAADKLDLLTDGAIETINDAACDKTGGPVVEGDDPLELNLDTWKELVA
jgi:hypothetical protein